MTVKTDMYDRLVMRFSNTLLMDTQTGTPVSETDIAAGDKVFVYYADYVMETEPPHTDAAAVLVNLEDGHAPARLLIAEAIQHPAEEDGSVTILTDNGELLLTVQKDTDIRPLGTKNIASADDTHMGTRFFAWYDQVALSEPGQVVATRIVIPAQQQPFCDRRGRGHGTSTRWARGARYLDGTRAYGGRGVRLYGGLEWRKQKHISEKRGAGNAVGIGKGPICRGFPHGRGHGAWRSALRGGWR